MAMVHVAMYDAVNSIEHGYAPYKFDVAAAPDSSSEAAAIAAAHAVLVKLYPEQKEILDAAYAAALARIPDGNGKSGGVAVGESATSLLEWRARDGSDAPNDYRPVTTAACTS
jgi:hypothetical protein